VQIKKLSLRGLSIEGGRPRFLPGFVVLLPVVPLAHDLRLRDGNAVLRQLMEFLPIDNRSTKLDENSDIFKKRNFDAFLTKFGHLKKEILTFLMKFGH
jgi:hypothetical protein